MTEQAIPSLGPSSEPPATFEAALARRETIVRELEDGRIGLAEALARYEEGVTLLRQCFGQLESAERRIELLTGVDAAGNPAVQPFDDTASTERAEQGAPRSRSRTASGTKSGSATPGVAKKTASRASPTPEGPSGSDSDASPAPDSTKMDVPKGLF